MFCAKGLGSLKIGGRETDAQRETEAVVESSRCHIVCNKGGFAV